MPNGQLGIVAAKAFSGLMQTGWKVVAADMSGNRQRRKQCRITNAIDGNPSTFWHIHAWNSDLTLPAFYHG